MGHLLLVTGGTRSGKSHYAVERAGGWGSRVLYIATCQPADDEMRERVRRHQAERPSTWTTLEPGSNVLPAVQEQGPDSDGILLDCLTLYVSGLLMLGSGEEEVRQKVDELCSALRKVGRPAAIVTNEVGWGVVPETPLGRLFRDAAGRANQVAARHAQEVVLMVSGLPMMVKNT
jgi:adenosylcobinamide kinase / adenosylcobinamide-phosphate guanylyltransferase